jgi:putative AbiEi antitoxin of type IV toxin-antitoxin system/uncharacterized protein DUF559
MTADVPPSLTELAEIQRGIITARQAAACGITRAYLKSRVRQGRWQRLHRGVYATFSGEVGRDAMMWAAVLAVGEGAVLSHRSAAELWKLTDEPCEAVHVTVPSDRRVRKPEGVVIHLSTRAAQAAHPTLIPPRTRVEETILDLADAARGVDEVIGWVSRGLGRGLTVQGKLRAALAQRGRVRWRADLTEFLSADMAGLLSVLEFRYFRNVERPHGLPVRKRQSWFRQGRRSGYRDTLYEKYGLIVELDGQVAHPAEAKWRDARRDNIAASQGLTTLRLGWQDVTVRPCDTAAQVAAVLARRGYTGFHGCSPDCPVAHVAAAAAARSA